MPDARRWRSSSSTASEPGRAARRRNATAGTERGTVRDRSDMDGRSGAAAGSSPDCRDGAGRGDGPPACLPAAAGAAPPPLAPCRRPGDRAGVVLRGAGARLAAAPRPTTVASGPRRTSRAQSVAGEAARMFARLADSRGGVAQLGERRVRNAKVGSSILLLSTTRFEGRNLRSGLFFGAGPTCIARTGARRQATTASRTWGTAAYRSLHAGRRAGAGARAGRRAIRAAARRRRPRTRGTRRLGTPVTRARGCRHV